MSMTILTKYVKERILSEGVEAVRISGLKIKVVEVDRGFAELEVWFVDKENNDLFMFVKQHVAIGYAMTLFDMDEPFRITVSQTPEIESIKKLSLGPYDVLVLYCNDYLSENHVKHIRDAIRNALGERDNKVLVIENGSRLGVITPLETLP